MGDMVGLGREANIGIGVVFTVYGHHRITECVR